MTTATATAPAPVAPDTSRLGVLRRGLALSPELFTGLAGTLGLAVLATAGRVAVPVAIQQGIDHGLRGPHGADLGVLTTIVGITAGVLMVTMVCAYLMNVRLFTVSETALAGIRARTFRHIHDLSMLHQQSERRGALVSRVTGDVDQISQFLQFGGLLFVINLGQLIVTTAVMLFFSWKLTLVVFAAFAPLVFVVRFFQRRLSVLYLDVRESVGAMLGVIAEAVVGAPVVRAYGIQRRTGERLDAAIEKSRRNQFRAQTNNVISMSFGELAAGLALGGVIVVGTLLGVDKQLSVGELTAFLFLATLFVQPVQVATEVLNEAQNAIAGWRRVLDIVETEPDVADPGAAGRPLPDGPVGVTFEHVHFAYPDGPEVLTDVDLTVAPRTRVAVVGETGSGKTTFAKLLTRLMDPTRGRVLLAGAPLPDVRFDSLRSRVVMVPQDGFLFDATVADNVRFARPSLTDADLHAAFTELGLQDWLDSLSDGLQTPVGERGEALSVGERQLVALARAYVADPDLLVLDEATSAVDPATEVRLQRTLDAVTRGRTTVAIAHRLSTAQAADEVIVVDRGRVVQRGPHAQLVTETDSIYARLYASWLEQTR
jgi:ABC-type multidrug transport system fused ATPase/permease subunit